MTKLRPMPAKEVCRKLRKLGFVMIRQKGSHTFWKHPDGRCTVVPVHKGEDISKGLLHSILNDIQISFDEFEKI
ncbi:MAG: type II toxin-antitoxin system HicA family toxin [Candidatus Omnitrophica bacterium]|nr:type II toxin-antitoxin system HicA family toxin [Candidatus Omnitrophota bacterium]